MSDGKSSLRWSVSPSVRATFSEDGAALLDIAKGQVYSLNSVGTRVWQLLQMQGGKCAFNYIVETLALQFSVPQDRLARDVGEYLDELARNGLIVVVE